MTDDRQPTQEDIDELRFFITREVAAGVLDADEIEEAAMDHLAGEVDEEWLRDAVPEMIAAALAEHLAAQAAWPAVTDCDRLDAAFRELDRRGIVARQNFSCCQNCGSKEIWGEVESARERGMEVRGCTYYHAQDLEGAAEGDGLHLAYDSVAEGDGAMVAVGREIAETLGRHGLAVEWDGDPRRRLYVPLDWKRRRAVPA